jgi:ribosome-associated protein
VLDLREVTSFTDHFVICSGLNARQLQAIANEIGERIAEAENRRPLSVEGYENAEWVLLDYGDLVIHIFSESARKFYDLERLWRTATEVELKAS